jgi:Domain of unknown function (DUF4328)
MDYPDQAPLDLFSMSPVPRGSTMNRAELTPVPPGYTSPRSRARWTLSLLGLTLGVQVLSLFALLEERSLLGRGVGQVTLLEWQTSSGRVSHLATAEIVLFVFTAIAFLFWLHRCYANLLELGSRDLRFTPGSAVGYWFVPILNLFRPKQILDELWQETAPLDGGDAEGAAKKTTLTAFWLGALLTSVLTARIAGAMGKGSISDLKSTTTWLIVACLADIAAAALAYALVSALTARQELRAS